jgi:hypothetical protein
MVVSGRKSAQAATLSSISALSQFPVSLATLAKHFMFKLLSIDTIIQYVILRIYS